MYGLINFSKLLKVEYQHLSKWWSQYSDQDTGCTTEDFGDCLTVHRSITLVDLQLDAQNSYLFTSNTFIKILYLFPALPCSSSGGLRRNCIYAASGIVTVCRWLSCAPVHKTVTCREWRYQKLIFNYDVDLFKMSRVMLETCRGF